MANDLFNTHRATYPYSTQWLWFYVKVRLFIGILLQLGQCISMLREYDLGSGNAILIIAMILQVALLLFLFWTYIEMRKFTRRSFLLNRILILLEGLSMILNAFGVFSTIWISILAGLFVASAWIVPNWIYFNKRRELFCDPIVPTL